MSINGSENERPEGERGVGGSRGHEGGNQNTGKTVVSHWPRHERKERQLRTRLAGWNRKAKV